jgi:hypothetical protein
MLNAFLEWGNKRCVEFARNGFNVSLTSGEATSNSSARLDIDSEKAMARITAWDSGDVDLEIINIETEASMYSRQLSLTSPFRFDDEFHDFFVMLKLKAEN